MYRHKPITASFMYGPYQVWATSNNVYDKNSLRIKFTDGSLNEYNIDEIEGIDWERLQAEAIYNIESELFESF